MLQAGHHLVLHRRQQHQQYQQQSRMLASSTEENLSCPFPPQAWADDIVGHSIDFAGFDEHSMTGDIYEPVPINMNNLEIIQPENNGGHHNQLFLRTFAVFDENSMNDDIYEPVPINMNNLERMPPEHNGVHRNQLYLSKFLESNHCVTAGHRKEAQGNEQDFQSSELVSNMYDPKLNFVDMSSASSKSEREAPHGHNPPIPGSEKGIGGMLVKRPSSYNVPWDKVMPPSGGLNPIQSFSIESLELSQCEATVACNLSNSNRSSSDKERSEEIFDASRSELSISSRSSSSQQRFSGIYDDRWDQRFSQLLHFVKMHGHARVPVRYQSNLSLSKWAKRQRYHYKLKYEGKHSTLSDEREQKLIDIGFEWDIRCTVWEERFDELVEFKRLNGHMRVPIGCPDFPKLGSWVKCARRQGKLYARGEPSSMTADRAAKLQAIGFKWEARSSP